MTRRLAHPLVLVTILLIIQLFLFLFLATRPQRIAPPNRTYPPVGYGYYYVNVMRQAIDGSWGVRDPNTTRPVKRANIYIFFSAVGKIAKILSVDPILMYEIVHVLGGVLLFFASYWFISILVPRASRFMAVLLVLGLEISEFGNIQFPFDAQNLIARHFGLPHHVWGEVLGLLTLGYCIVLYRKPSRIQLPLLFILTFAAAETLPSYLATVCVPIFSVLFLWGMVTKTLRKLIPPLATVGIAIAIVGLLLKMEFAKGLPYSNFANTEKSWATNTSLIQSYLSTFIIYIPFFIMLLFATVGKIRTWSSNLKLTMLLSIAWIAAPLIEIPMSTHPFFPIANWRLVEGNHYVPAGILAAIGITECISLLKQSKIRIFFTWIIVITIITYSAVAITQNVRKKMDSQNLFWSNIYPLTSTMNAIYFLDTVPKSSGIMVREFMGELIPGFANVRVFIDGPLGYPDWPERQWITHQFYSGQLAPEEAAKILRDNDVSYVFYGPDEQSLTTTPMFYPDILTPVYTNDAVTIFSFKR
jgi:hypothetical protein